MMSSGEPGTAHVAPFGHSNGALLPSGQYQPGSHGVREGSVVLAGQYVPLGHSTFEAGVTQ